MKTTALLLVALAAGAAALAPACGPIDEEPGTGDGDMGGESGDGDGDMGGDPGDGDGDGDGDGTGGTEGRDDCSETITGQGGSSDSCEEPALPEVEIEIAGIYVDEFEATVTITNEAIEFEGGATYFFSQVDNTNDTALALNGLNDLDPCKWSKFAWVVESDELYYCQSTYDADSECDALDADGPDTTDLDTGCDGEPWFLLTAE